jgi:hypothetical protein
VTLKTSTIYIAVGAKTRVYRSVSEVPVDLRRKLVESTSGGNSTTILIADRRGRQEILKAIRQEPSQVTTRLLPRPAVPGGPEKATDAVRELWSWLGAALTVAAGLGAWFFASTR